MRAFIVFAAIMVATSAGAQNPDGSYSGPVEAKWDSNGRTMTLLDNLSYTDPTGHVWTAPKGSVVDGASIPQFAWSIIGGPFEGKYRDSSVIHDVGCVKKWAPWETVHEVFYWGMLTSGVEEWRAKVMYAAVYHFGPRWPQVVAVAGMPFSQSTLALQQALQGKVGGSLATIQSISPPPTAVISEGPATFQVLVSPPDDSMTESRFNELAHEIEQDAGTGKPTPSLEEIRAYK